MSAVQHSYLHQALCNCAAHKGHAEAATPQDDVADSRGVGVAGCGVVGVTVIGAQRPEIDVQAPACPSKPVAVIDYSCINIAIRGFRQRSTSSEK
jgi:hypothetical protein